MKLPSATSPAWMLARFVLVFGGLFAAQFYWATNFDRTELWTLVEVGGLLLGYDIVQARKARRDAK